MKDRSNHVVAGLVFVGVCILIAAVTFAFLRPSSGVANAADEQAVNTMVADLDPGPSDAPKQDMNANEAPVAIDDGNVPQLGACHMGECSWSVEKARDTVRQEADDKLIKVTLQGGTSQHPSNNYPQRYARSERISWNQAPHDVYVFCSKTLPAVMLQDGGSWQTDVLDFVNGPPGVLESSATLYVRVCHGPTAAYPSDDFAARYGYVTEPLELDEGAVSTPTDIVALAQRTRTPG
jgi:hypothetical protein